jgi:hypothetical protein
MQPPSNKTVAERRARAEAAFKVRHEQKVEAPKATREYREAEQQQRDQMTKLRSERKARENA